MLSSHIRFTHAFLWSLRIRSERKYTYMDQLNLDSHPFLFMDSSAMHSIPRLKTCLWDSDNHDDFETFYHYISEESLDLFRLNQRISSMNAKWNVKWNLLPFNNPYFNAEEFITSILHHLQTPDPSYPLLGYYVLYHSSSNKWKQVLLQSVAASTPDIISQFEKEDCRDVSSSETEQEDSSDVQNYNDKDWYVRQDSKIDLFLHALKNAMSRPKNQFEILTIENSYRLYFPGNVVDYDDGKCWVEVHLRHVKTDELLVIMGWSLIRKNDGPTFELSSVVEALSPSLASSSASSYQSTVDSWTLDGLDWQDFRNDFRPGIGREEWERICG